MRIILMATIQDVRAVHNPQRAYEWEVELFGGDSGVSLLKERAKTISIPEKSVDTIIINYKSQKAHYSGRNASPSTVTVTFWDDEDHTVYNYFNNWLENKLTDSEVGGGVTADQYTANMVIRTLGHDSESVTGAFTLTRVFPTSIGDIQLSYEQSEHVEISVTFSFDSNISGDQS